MHLFVLADNVDSDLLFGFEKLFNFGTNVKLQVWY